MTAPAIYVCAVSHRVARDFIAVDLREDPARLRYIDSADRLRGLNDLVLYLHPSAILHKNYDEIRHIAALRGAILATIDDSDARALHAARRRQA